MLARSAAKTSINDIAPGSREKLPTAAGRAIESRLRIAITRTGGALEAGERGWMRP